jgi:hypothetical protein
LTPELSFIPRISRDGVSTDYRYDVNWWTGYDDFLVPDAQRRDTFELRISQTHLKFCMPDYDFCWIDLELDTPLTWDQGIVQFVHSSYNPTKDGAGVPNTWHWDNVQIINGKPFTIIQGNRRYLDKDNTTISFNAPAPNNASLRFAGIGSNIEVSFDNGNSWEFAQKNPQDNDTYHFSSYFTPIPAGTTVVKFRADNWGNNFNWQVRDITIWSKEATNGIMNNFKSTNQFSPTQDWFSGFSNDNYCYIPEE